MHGGQPNGIGIARKAPAVGGWSVCQIHGVGGGAPSGPGNGAWRHGGRSKETTYVRTLAAELAQLAVRALRS